MLRDDERNYMIQKLSHGIVLMFLLFIISISCSKPSKLPQANVDTNPAEMEAAIFPHSEKFKGTRLHGLEFYANANRCKGCHGKDLGGGNVKVSCQTCHVVFPHTDEFKTTTLHGTEYFKNKAVCTTCHGVDYRGGNSKTACNACHSYPHPAKWALPEYHGTEYLKLREKCLTCHGEESSFKKQHPEPFVSCGSCHPLIPHGPSFETGGHASLARTYKGQCTLCHTDYKRLFPNTQAEGCRSSSCHGEEGTSPLIKWRTP